MVIDGVPKIANLEILHLKFQDFLRNSEFFSLLICQKKCVTTEHKNATKNLGQRTKPYLLGIIKIDVWVNKHW